MLLSSCADEDMALVGALATGAAAGYAQTGGNTAAAESLLETQQQILNEASNTDAVNESSAASTPTYVTANPVPGKPGFAISPHSGKPVDVQGMAAGTLVEDPTSPSARFRVPQSSSASAPTPSTAGIVGTWKNSKLTWVLDANGGGRLIVPSTNNNGVATTYMTYQADSNSGVFAYTLTRSTLTGTLNCAGDSDLEITTNQSHTENYTLNGDTLTIGTEVMTRE
ncbi:MAG: hypothetical protein V4640_03425 [Verrucomicrobiota bacterium]